MRNLAPNHAPLRRIGVLISNLNVGSLDQVDLCGGRVAFMQIVIFTKVSFDLIQTTVCLQERVFSNTFVHVSIL